MTEIYIETDRLILRKPTMRDLPLVRSIYTNDAMMAHLGGVLDDAKADYLLSRWMVHWDLKGFGICVVDRKAGGESIGVVGIQIRMTDGEEGPDIGWMILPPFQRQGYATEATRAVLKMGIETHGMTHVVAWPDRDNTASIKILKSLNFKYVKDVDLPFLNTILRSSVWRYEVDRMQQF